MQSVLLMLLLAVPAQGQEASLPQPAQVLPPEVPPRPPLIAVPAEVRSSVDPPAIAVHKPPLSWRARAHKLRLSQNGQQKIIACGYDGAIMALIASLSPSALRVEILNSKAGEVLAVPIDPSSSQRFIFVLAEMPPGTVTVKGVAWSPSKSSAAVVEAVLNNAEQIALRRGAAIGSP